MLFEQLKLQNAERMERCGPEIRQQLEESIERTKASELHFFGNFVGLTFLGFEGDVFVTEVRSRPHILNTYGALQGGAAATIADITMGFMLLQSVGEVVTLEMKTNYVNAGKGDVFTSYAKIAGRSGRHYICECKTVNEHGTLITLSTGTFVAIKKQEAEG